MRLSAMKFLPLLILTSCAISPDPDPVACPEFPRFSTIDRDSASYINDVLNEEDGDPVLQSVLRDVLDTTASNNVTWNEYANKLEARARCEDS